MKNSSNPTVKGKVPPEPSRALPLIGHLHLLQPHVPLAHAFASLADKYGPIFTIRLGAYPAVVVSSQEAIKECFTTNDKILASRPKSAHGIHFGYNFAGFGFAPDGPYWRKLRKLVMLELLSPRRVESLRHVYDSEVDTFISDLYVYLGDSTSGKTKVVVISEWLAQLTLNILTRMIAGKRYFGKLQDVDDHEDAQRVVKLVKDFMEISGEFVPSDLIPLLGWFNFEGKVLKSMKKIAKDLDCLVGSWVEEHKKKERNRESSESEKQDFIDFMLSVIEEEDSTLGGHTRDSIIKANVLVCIFFFKYCVSFDYDWIFLISKLNIFKMGNIKVL